MEAYDPLANITYYSINPYYPNNRCIKAPVFRLKLLIMAGVEIFELPTLADFWHWRNPLLCQLCITATSQTTDVKKPSLSTEASNNGRGREVRTSSTRWSWHWRNPRLCQLCIITASQTTDVKKPQSFDWGFLNNGRRGEIRTHNTRWFLVLAESAALPIEHYSNYPNDRCKKAPVFRLRLLK